MARAPPPVANEDEETSEGELIDELFDLLKSIPERGFEASEDDKADLLEIIAELEESPHPHPTLTITVILTLARTWAMALDPTLTLRSTSF